MKPLYFLFTVLALSLPNLNADEKPPNVVLIFADDLGYGDLGCYGATKLKTPNIDKLAAEGRKFTDAHSASAVCTPSRYGLLTGEYPFKAHDGKGLWGPAPITSPLIIDTETNTIADVFKKSGYDTAVFGKWHLGFKEGRNDWQEPLRPGPQDLGFDYYFGMPVVNSAPPYVYVENDKIVGADPEDPLTLEGRGAKNVTPITPIPPEAAQRSGNQFSGAVEAHKLFNDFEVGTKLAEKATGWINEHKENPFFLYFSTTNVHHPFTPAKQFQGTSEAGWYGDFVHELDWIVGEVMKSLEESGVADNTLVIFTSDNGGMFNHGGRAAAELGHKINGDLLGSKFGIWEGGHRVPFIARWPGKIEAGTVSDQLLCSVDLMASFAALTEQELEDPKDSINMLPALTGDPEKALRTEMFMTPNKQSHMALRRGKWMFIPAKSDGGFSGSKPSQHAWGGAAVTTLVGTPNSDIANGKIKAGAPPAQLFDLEADVNQTKNLYYDNLDTANEMAEAIKKARKDAGFAPGKTADPQASAPAKDVGPPLSKYDDFKPVGNLHYSFEEGTFDGWKVTDGKLGEPVTKLPSLASKKDAPFARHGARHLSTLVVGGNKPLADTQTGVVESPSFKLTGDKVAFLVSGGFNKTDLYVALVDAESGDVLKQTGGSRDHRMRRVVWDVSKWKDKTVRFEVVDRVTGGWGHLNVDDFSAQGEPVEASSKPVPKAAAAAKPKPVDPPRDPSTKPNVIFVLMDDMGYSDVSCYGAKKVDTPNIDRMAAEGLQFTSFHTAASICSPSRAAFLTGAYPQRNGLYLGINENREAHWFLGLNPDEITLAEQFKKQDYKTLMVGKWHLGTEEKFSYYNQGFDHYYGAPSNMGHNPEFLDERELVYKKVDITKLSELYTKRVVKHIEDHRDEPFFLYFSHNYPHTPIKPGKAFEKTSKGGPRGDAIQEIDWGIGEMLTALEANGILENTLVIFTSDNGATSQEFSAPYRGTKYVSLEGGHRVPFILYWKGMIQEPAVLDVPVNAMDLFPTLSELISEAMPSDRKYDGVSLTPLFKGDSIARDPNEPFYYYNCENLQAVRVGDWKLELPRTREQMPWWNHQKAKPIETPRLYNLKSDKAESSDLSSANPDKVVELQKLAETTRGKLGEFMERGTEQRPTGSLFPEVPIMSNQKQNWDSLSDEVKGRAKTEFKKAKRKK